MSPATIAPERIPQLREKFLNMDLTISDDKRFQCEAFPTLNTVRLSRRVVELAWAFSYSYWEIYQVVFDGRQLTGEPIDWHNFGELVPALRLLRWSQQGLIGEHEEDWPAELPKPGPIAHTTHPSMLPMKWLYVLSRCISIMNLHTST